jgi:prepilin peptidase CpaA
LNLVRKNITIEHSDKVMPDFSHYTYAVVPVIGAAMLLLTAAYTDITEFRIPNWLCLSLALLFFVFGYFSTMGYENFLLRSGIGLAVLIFGMFMHARGVVGGGDVKLLASLSPWLAPDAWPLFMLTVMIFGGILALLILVLRKSKAWWPENVITGRKVQKLLTENEGIPYGVAISLAGIISLGELLEQLKLFG